MSCFLYVLFDICTTCKVYIYIHIYIYILYIYFIYIIYILYIYKSNEKTFKISLYFDFLKSSTDWKWNPKYKNYIQVD